MFKAKKMNFSIALEDAAFIYEFEKGQLWTEKGNIICMHLS